MRNILVQVKGFGYMLWHAKHEVIHVILGVSWVWMLQGYWNQMQPAWITVAVVGSLIPDIDHLIYFFTYGKKDPYTVTIRSLLRKRQWRILISFVEKGHKHNTNLMFHNVYTVGCLLLCTGVAYLYDLRMSAIFLGAMVSHFLFDIVEDLILLGSINANWMRFGRPKKRYARI